MGSREGDIRSPRPYITQIDKYSVGCSSLQFVSCVTFARFGDMPVTQFASMIAVARSLMMAVFD